jgi:hypothetical protein
MPYIKPEDRAKLAPLVEQLRSTITQQKLNAGDLNYLMSIMAKAYVDANGLRYEHLNTVAGVFDSAKAEFQRRVVAPYEDAKIKENGDVY